VLLECGVNNLSQYEKKFQQNVARKKENSFELYNPKWLTVNSLQAIFGTVFSQFQGYFSQFCEETIDL